MAKTESELLPCPFCGCIPEVVQSSHPFDDWVEHPMWLVACRNKSHRLIQMGAHDSEHSAIEAWNRRAANSDGGVEPIPQLYRWREKGGEKWRYSDVTPDKDDRHWNEIQDMQPLYVHPPAKALDGIAVNALEWRVPTDHPQDYEDALWVCAGLGGQYSITKEGEHFLLWEAGDNFIWHKHATIKEAKAAAQADFDQRIRAAIK